MLRMRRVGGAFKQARMLGSVDFSLREKRMLSLVNSSKDKGAALLHYLGFLRAPSGNIVHMGSRLLFSTTGPMAGRRDRVHGGELRFKLMFRSFGLFPRCATLKGMVLTGRLLTGDRPSCGTHGGRVRTRVRTRTGGLLSRVKLSRHVGGCPRRLSKKRYRHITVTHTLTLDPSVLYFSRPASTLSPRLANRMLGIVGKLTSRGAAVVVMARRVTFTESMSSGILFVSSNGVLRRKAPRRIFRGPGRRHAHRFLSHCAGK